MMGIVVQNIWRAEGCLCLLKSIKNLEGCVGVCGCTGGLGTQRLGKLFFKMHTNLFVSCGFVRVVLAGVFALEELFGALQGAYKVGGGSAVTPPIPHFPSQCFTKGAALHSRSSFHPKVVGMCQSQRTGTVGFKISKIIVVGDLSVGKTCLINRFCKDTFDKNYKATIGVDFEMERFEVLGVPFSLQLWDTAGQERFKCIASTYYRGAQAIIIVFDLNDVASLGHTRQWLADALKENDPSSAILFLVGTKKDLSSPAQYSLIEREALKVAKEMEAEYWAVSSLTGENVREFFFRVAALTFEGSVMAELERSSARRIGDVVRIHSDEQDLYLTEKRRRAKCCQ
uniref:Ras-related protein Rab-34 n=1 Tax=Podarcis muralis TaxID=64176 RepID=A0A670JNP1_PODMU